MSRAPIDGPRTADFVREMQDEFPDFEILYKDASRLQRAIHGALALVTLGGQRKYLTHYHTVLFGKLWVPRAWDRMSDVSRYVLLRHERVHLRQRARMGDVWMGAVYLFWIFPLGLAWGRARIEWEAYEETIRATAETEGLAAAATLKDEIVRRFVGPDYGWMWPFRAQVERWFDEALAQVRAELEAGDPLA